MARSRPLRDQRVKAEAAAIAVQGKDQLEDEQEEVSPRPFAFRIVEAEPQIEDLERAYQTPQPDKHAEDQRHCSQDLGRINNRREYVEMRQYDIVDKIGL